MKSPGAVAFSIMGFSVRWYGILIAIGAVLAVLIGCRRAPRHGMTSDRLLDYVLIALPLGVVGARAYYVLFNLEDYGSDIIKMINIRLGGLAIHGGLIAAFAAVFIMSRIRRDSFFNLCDLAAPCVALAQSIGRWGNFFNEEAHGSITDFPIYVLIDGVHYHATFLYESAWCMMLFLLLSHLDRHRKFTGQIACLYCMLYSLERFFVETLRTDSLMVGPFKQAMVISVCIFATGAAAYMILSKKALKKQD